MDKEQIDERIAVIEIEKELCGKPCDICKMYGKECMPNRMAQKLAKAGYRKQIEGEWVEHVKISKEGKPLLRHYQCNLCGVYLATQANFCPHCGAKMKGGAR